MQYSIRLFLLALIFAVCGELLSQDQMLLDNGTVKIGIDRGKGGAITWLSWHDYPHNMVNVADPGRLIQQSYYAGKSLDRTAEGQSRAWSPWTWNPIQGGGVGSWARVTKLDRLGAAANGTLYSETVPKLWDMPNEEAEAVMRQWTRFEPGMPDVVVVKCEFHSNRQENDRWGPAVSRSQEIPACYFTRNFFAMKTYLGDDQWRDETIAPGPPWGKSDAPRRAVAMFEANGQGVAVFSPASTGPWNLGPHGRQITTDPSAGPCMHVAPLDRVNLGPKSEYRYQYWLVVGDANTIAQRLDVLWQKYSSERTEHTP